MSAVRVGDTVRGECCTCGRKGVTGVVRRWLGNGMAVLNGSEHSHAHRMDDGADRGNGVVRIERAVVTERDTSGCYFCGTREGALEPARIYLPVVERAIDGEVCEHPACRARLALRDQMRAIEMAGAR